MNDLHVIEKGTGSPIVWIHGFPLSSLIFEQQLEIPGVLHLAPDLPGFGSSPASEVTGIDDYAAAIASLIRQRNLDKVVIAGVSMGGYVALSLVRHAPERVAGLLLIDTRETPDTAEGKANRFAQVERASREGTGFLVSEMLPKMLTEETISAGDRRVEIVRHAMESASVPGVQAALRAMAGRPDSSDALRAFAGPVLVVVGDRDAITPPSDAERMARLAPAAELVTIEASAHLSNVERPQAFNAAVSAFMERLR